jgi:tRNA A-37 threonylcarbamoyl transferase component Bud32
MTVGHETEPLLGPDTLVDEYKVLRLIGRGGMGEVYLARDTRLGRKVALKVIRPEALGDAEARERFLNEAKVTARFSHPNIVTLFGAGDHAGCPYVALEYLPGQTLRERLDEERPALKEALRLGRAIAEALAEAHRHDVLHRDLKPQNILIPADGRLRVLDFGLAKQLHDDEAAGNAATLAGAGATVPGASGRSESTIQPVFETRVKGLRGTPAYMAPEQWAEEPVGRPADVWALGLILHELLAGRHPFGAAGFHKLCLLACGDDPVPSLAGAGADVPPVIAALVDRCVLKDPAQRPTAEEVALALDEQLTGGARRTVENPFRGLMPFAERHAALFFGREPEVAAFLERLRSEPVLPVVGPSGAGKSSFVQAGVIPRLRELGPWLVLHLRPGAQPFETLASRLLTGESTCRVGSAPGSDPSRSAPDSTAGDSAEERRAGERRLTAELQEAPERLSLELARLARGQRVLLFVDQLEELYTLLPQTEAAAAVRQRFMQALAGAADDPEGPVRVIFTLRDDFLGRLAEGETARQALSRVTVLRAPGPEALREILEQPVALAGYRWEDPALPAEMVRLVQGEAAALPLLQFAGQRLWDRRDQEGRRITRVAYVPGRAPRGRRS